MTTQNHAEKLRIKANFLPSKFVDEQFDRVLLTVLAHSFGALLVRHAQSDSAWRDCLSKLRKHGLLELRVPMEYTPDTIRLDITETDGCRREHAYVWKEALASGFRYLPVGIERTRLNQPAYLEEVSGLLAYLFAWKLFADSSDNWPNVLIIGNLDSEILYDYLTLKGTVDVSSGSLFNFLLERVIVPQVEDFLVMSGFDRLRRRWTADL